jgi:hypothetical protein
MEHNSPAFLRKKCLFFPWNNGFANILAHEKCDDRARGTWQRICAQWHSSNYHIRGRVDTIGTTWEALAG